MSFAPELFWAFQTRATFLAIFEKFSLVPPMHFFRKCGFFGWPCLNCHNMAIRALLDPLFAPRSCPVLPLQAHTKYRRILFAPKCFWAFQTRATYWAICGKIPLVPPLHFFGKWGFWVTLRKLPYLGHSGTFGAAVLASIFSSLWKISLGSPFVLFQKMRLLGDFSKIAITWPFGHFWSCCLRLILFQSLQFKCILIRG